MRLVFWRPAKGVVAVEGAVGAPAAAIPVAVIPQVGGRDGLSVGRVGRWFILPVLSALLAIAVVNSINPRFESEARILIDGRDNVIMRPGGERSEALTALDPEAVTNQLQLLLSRDLAREIITKNKLAERSEFDPVLEGISPVRAVLALFGIVRDPLALSPQERVLDSYYERLTAYAVDKSRVIVIQFQSRDPELAASVANSIADSYLALQHNGRQEQARSTGQLPSAEIENQRKKVAEAESRVEQFRANSPLLAGTISSTSSNQRLTELSAQLNDARALKSMAETKAQLVRDLLQGTNPIQNSEMLSSELLRWLSEQRVALRAQLAGLSSTLLDGHPRMKELRAQLADLDRQMRDEARKLSRSLDNDARISATKVISLTETIEQLKKQAVSSNGQDLQLRSLERDAKAQRDLLEDYLAKYREANTRENIDTAQPGSRVISRATVSNAPAYPKKLPIVLIAALATLVLRAGVTAARRLLRLGVSRQTEPFAPGMVPEQMAIEPTLFRAPSSADHVPTSQIDPENRIDATFGLAPELGEVERIAAHLCSTDQKARKVTVLGSASGESITLTALTLARLIARKGRVVLVDLSGSSPAVPAVSVDPTAPGLAELMLGQTSFSQIITKDRLSPVHLVNAGRRGFDRHLLHSPRLAVAVDALLKVYDHVVMDAGAASDLHVELLATDAFAVVVPDISMSPESRGAFCEQLKAVGFSGVGLLSKPVMPTAAAASSAREAA